MQTTQFMTGYYFVQNNSIITIHIQIFNFILCGAYLSNSYWKIVEQSGITTVQYGLELSQFDL